MNISEDINISVKGIDYKDISIEEEYFGYKDKSLETGVELIPYIFE